MSLLFPWALLLAGLAAVPLTLHLRRRRSLRRIAFPALRHLRRVREGRARSLRTRDLLLLALRVALVATLALLAAGPLVGRGGASDHDPTDLALVVDNSGSTARLVGDGTVLKLLRERASLALAAARPGDRFWVFPVVGPARAAGASAGPAREALERLEATDGRGELDLGALVARAAASLPSTPGRHREVHLLTDGQATAYGPAAPGASAASAGAAPSPARDRNAADAGAPPLLVYHPPSLPAANGAVVSAEPSAGSRVPAGVEQSLAVRARRWPSAAPDSSARASLRLEVDGRTTDGTLVRWGETAVFRLPAMGVGMHRGSVEIEPDGLRADDAHPFALVVFPPPAVVRRGPPDTFLAHALETLRDGGRTAGARENPAEAAIHVMEGVAGPGVGEVARAVAPGPGAPGAPPAGAGRALVLVPPEDPVDLAAFRQLLERTEVPWRPVGDDSSGDLRLAAGAGVAGLDSIRIRLRYRLVPSGPGAAADSVLLRTRDGEPWLVRGRTGGTVYLLLASPLVPAASSLPTSPAMIPFTEALLLRWPGDEGWPGGPLTVGLPVPLPPTADSIRTPGGRSVRVEGGAPFRPLGAGIHLLYGAGDGPLPFAARVPEAESDLAPLPEARLQELFAGREVDIAGPGAPEWEEAIFRARRGAAADGWLLALAVLLAVAEVAVATPGRAGRTVRRREAPGT